MSFNHLLAFLKTSLEFGGEESFNEVWNMRDEVNVYCSQACLYNHGNNCQLNMISGKLCSAWESHVCIWAPFPPWILSPTSLLSTPPPPQNQTSQMVHRLYNGWNSCNDNISMKCHRGLSHNTCKDRRSLWITTTCPIKKLLKSCTIRGKPPIIFFWILPHLLVYLLICRYPMFGYLYNYSCFSFVIVLWFLFSYVAVSFILRFYCFCNCPS